MITKLLLASSLCIVCASALAQPAMLNPTVPKPGVAAPALVFNHLMQAAPGTKTDWPSLRGKVVVLEFWATWCAPCIAEIPVLNALADSTDSAKVQFISVDDEDAALVAAFLKKKPISGWIGIDTTGKLFDRYGIDARPATIVIGPDGRVVSNSVPPQDLTRKQLLALAGRKPINLGADADPKAQVQVDKALAESLAAESAKASTSPNALFEISLSPGDPAIEGKKPDSHSMLLGNGKVDMTNASPSELLSTAAEVPSTRIHAAVNLPDTCYNLHVNAPDADPKQLAEAIELAISNGAHLRIEHHTSTVDAYVLSGTPDAQSHFTDIPYPGFAVYQPKKQTVRGINATADQLASALEEALGTPVVNESALSGKIMVNLQIAPKNLASAKAALVAIGLTLTPAQRPIETVNLSAAPPSASESAQKAVVPDKNPAPIH